jgi:hypothetical protein
MCRRDDKARSPSSFYYDGIGIKVRLVLDQGKNSPKDFTGEAQPPHISQDLQSAGAGTLGTIQNNDILFRMIKRSK